VIGYDLDVSIYDGYDMFQDHFLGKRFEDHLQADAVYITTSDSNFNFLHLGFLAVL
jgi:hypothetical protein